MIIKSIEFKNFRQFKTGKFEFSTDSTKKISIIVGDNTFGKTTIVRAFLWCLFQENDFEDKIMLNSEVQDNMSYGGGKQKAQVIIELNHGTFSYRISTSESYYCSIDGKIKGEGVVTSILRVDSNGSQQIPGDKVSSEIAKILSPELKDFFFYDGENNKIENITAQKKSKLQAAVSKIVGIERIEILKSYYDPQSTVSVIAKLRNNLITVDPYESEKLNGFIEEYKKDIDSSKKDIDNYNQELLKLQDQLSNIESLISENDDVIEEQRRKREIENNLNQLKKDKPRLFDDMISTLNSSNSFLKSLFAYNFLSSNLKEELKKATFSSEKSYKYITEKAIDQFIAQGECICGRKFCKGDDAYLALLASKEHMEPHDYGKYASDFSDGEDNNYQFSKSILYNIRNKAIDLLDNIENIDNSQKDYSEIVKNLEGRPDVGELQKEASEINNQISNFNGSKSYCENRIPDIEEKLKKVQDKLDSLTDKTEENDFTNRCIDYANNIYKAASSTITSKKNEARTKLERLVDDIFQQMYQYPGERKVSIDENFIAEAKLISGKKQEKSTGLKTVLNYSFVAGLMQLIKEKIVNDEFADSELVDDYPLVMDAPFSNTDEGHITKICKELPQYCNQIIICVMKKDFGNAIETIEPLIGKQYTIIKNNASDSSIVEVK